MLVSRVKGFFPMPVAFVGQSEQCQALKPPAQKTYWWQLETLVPNFSEAFLRKNKQSSDVGDGPVPSPLWQRAGRPGWSSSAQTLVGR